MQKKLIIIGAGPAGLFTAVNSKIMNNNLDILILEKNSRPGIKLLMSGSGKCNITHQGDVEHFLNHYGENYIFLISALYKFNNKALLNFFEKRDINFTTKDNGKIFPSSFKAEDILDVLLEECSRLGIEIKYSSAAVEINYLEEESRYIIKTKTQEYLSDMLVIASGGKSYPSTGSNGDSYLLAQSLGHNIIQPKAALTPIYIKNYKFSNLAGISLENIELSLWRQNKVIKRWSGDILFTHKGLSGPAILNYSRYFSADDIIKINFTNAADKLSLENIILDKINDHGNRKIKNVIRDFNIPNRLISALIKNQDIDGNKKASQITKFERKNITELLYAFSLKIKKLGSFNEAMVTKGGVDTREINPSTMESNLKKGLFIVGEALDIDGDTGGYNLQAAFSTAYSAAVETAAR